MSSCGVQRLDERIFVQSCAFDCINDRGTNQSDGELIDRDNFADRDSGDGQLSGFLGCEGALTGNADGETPR